MLIVWLDPTCTQFNPSDDMYALKLFPLLTNFTQYGSDTFPLPVRAEVLPPAVERTKSFTGGFWFA
jgi:hypothetical protein